MEFTVDHLWDIILLILVLECFMDRQKVFQSFAYFCLSIPLIFNVINSFSVSTYTYICAYDEICHIHNHYLSIWMYTLMNLYVYTYMHVYFGRMFSACPCSAQIICVILINWWIQVICTGTALYIYLTKLELFTFFRQNSCFQHGACNSNSHIQR